MQEVDGHLEEYKRRINPEMKDTQPLNSILDVELFGVSGHGRESS